jgi:hypothetical protein
MKLRQYVYFRVWSDTLDPETLTARIGIEPDEIGVRGSRHSNAPKPVPRSHSWEVRCDERGVTLGAQVEQVMARLAPAREAIRDLVAGEDDAHAQLKVVRWFGDEDGDEEVGPIVDNTGSVVREGLWLFGWHLDMAVLGFLVYVGAEVDVDEYDMLQDDDNGALGVA